MPKIGYKQTENHRKIHLGEKQSQETIQKKANKLRGQIRVKREIRTCICGCKEIFECRKTSKQKYKNSNHYNHKTMLGKIFTKQHCKNIAKETKGKHFDRNNKTYEQIVEIEIANQWKRKQSEVHKGIKFTEEHHKNLSKSKKLQNHPNWLGGKSFELYGLEFNNNLKKQVKERDDYTCQICKLNEKQLKFLFKRNKQIFHAHHIDYNKKNNNENNLLTLCYSCHPKTNSNREYWISTLKRR